MTESPSPRPATSKPLVLCALSRKATRQTAAFMLENEIGVEVLEAETVGRALEILLSEIKLEAFVTDYPDGFEASFKLLKATQNKLPVYLILNKQLDADEKFDEVNIAGTFEGRAQLEELVARMREDFSDSSEPRPTDDAEIESDADRFCRIRIELIDRKNPLLSDIYIRLGASKFVKLFHRGDMFDRVDSYRYLVEKKIPYLYVEKHAVSQLVQTLNETFKDRLAAARPGHLDADFTTSVHEVALEIFARSGLTPDVETLIKSNVMLCVKSMAAKPRMKAILDKISVDRSKYISSHSVALAQLSCSMAAVMDWGSTSTFQKLTLASFLHDIEVDSQDLAQLQTREEMDEVHSNYSRETLKNYVLHPSMAAEIAKSLEEVPPDVDTIIAQHHERPDGTGFPRGLTNAQIHPLAALFIVTHDLLIEMNRDESLSVDEFVANRSELYGQGNFKQVLKALKASNARTEPA